MSSSKTMKEDKEAKMEVLNNVKQFLTEKIKKNEEEMQGLKKDIDILKDLLRVEKQLNKKNQQVLQAKEKEVEEIKKEKLTREQN